ncbi:hypothetical protein [Arsenophonus endosymbiont of Bemisia tabaci]|uniref:hypothetical protein n=1 Tax=Arsenophonus endosymbiont of Bemisia tabaci TaxID=536059 RepID=UPI0015F6038A|nr:hypothetical protein [Arsenophonus endosymbiont of Bemisia tabaci]
MQKKSARMRHRYFVRTQYGVIKIKSLSYIVILSRPIFVEMGKLDFPILSMNKILPMTRIVLGS